MRLRGRRSCAELAAVADELYNYYDPDEHEQDRSSSESETDSYQAEMLSDGALAVLAAQENANDEYQDTNDYWHDSDVEDVQPNKEDSEDLAAFVELVSH